MPEVIYKHIGLLLRLRRESEQLTQQEVAERSGFPQSAIARWEAGRARIQIHDLIKLADGLNIKPVKLWVLCASVVDNDLKKGE
jgi:transcriptional regulator with XRE-family HTH domain